MSDQYQPPRGASGGERNDQSGRPYDPARGQAPGSYEAGNPYAGQPYQPYGAPPSAGAPAGQYPGYGQPGDQPYGDPYAARPPYGPPAAGPYGDPYAGQPPYGQPGYPQPAGGPPAQVPSRAWPVALVSIGAVLMLLVAPIVFVVMAGQALSQTEFFSDLTKSTVSNPIQNRTYNKDDTIMAIVQPRDGAWRCVATDPKGHSFQLHQVSAEDSELGNAGERAYVASGDASVSGKYQVQCISGNNTHLQGMVLVSPEALRGAVGSFGVAFLVGTGVGVVGLVVLIVGIVWLVRVNRDRRRALSHSYLF